MGLGSTTKKIQKMVELGEELYKRLNEVREQLNDLKGTVEETGARVESLEAENERQRALLEALADERGIDVEAALADVGDEPADGEAEPTDGPGESVGSVESGPSSDNNP